MPIDRCARLAALGQDAESVLIDTLQSFGMPAKVRRRIETAIDMIQGGAARAKAHEKPCDKCENCGGELFLPSEEYWPYVPLVRRECADCGWPEGKPVPSELMACPFCGGSASHGEDAECFKVVRCDDNYCGAEIHYESRGKSYATRAWNRRAPSPVVAEVVKEMRRVHAEEMAGECDDYILKWADRLERGE